MGLRCLAWMFDFGASSAGIALGPPSVGIVFGASSAGSTPGAPIAGATGDKITPLFLE